MTLDGSDGYSAMVALTPTWSAFGVWPGVMPSRPALAGTSTSIATSPTVWELRKNSS
ncbi:hypothetical protein D3C72_2277230 [compost metagenome]